MLGLEGYLDYVRQTWIASFITVPLAICTISLILVEWYLESKL